MKTEQQTIIERLVDKSVDAFMFAIEVINKPSLKYRSENFAFNIINAWELLLKAYLVKNNGIDHIYYPNDKSRTITLFRCVEEVFPDYHNPVKQSILIISRLRNMSTHFVTPDYDDLYVQFFQANVLYYVNYTKKWFNLDINKKMPSNFLTIASNTKLLHDIKATNKLDRETFARFLKERKQLIKDSGTEGVAVSFDYSLRVVKTNEDFKVAVVKDSEDVTVQFINRYMDPNNSHPFRQKDIIDKVNNEFGEKLLNQYSFRAVKTIENAESNKEFFYFHTATNTKQYSQKFLNLLIKNIKEIPNYIETAISEYKKK